MTNAWLLQTNSSRYNKTIEKGRWKYLIYKRRFDLIFIIVDKSMAPMKASLIILFKHLFICGDLAQPVIILLKHVKPDKIRFIGKYWKKIQNKIQLEIYHRFKIKLHFVQRF